MTDEPYGELDELLTRIRLRVAQVRQTDPATGDELKGLFRQLELWIDSLVVDSLKLKSLKSKPKRVAKPKEPPSGKNG